jgi:hypothetical protein
MYILQVCTHNNVSRLGETMRKKVTGRVERERERESE